jgi:hypothetical protein
VGLFTPCVKHIHAQVFQVAERKSANAGGKNAAVKEAVSVMSATETALGSADEDATVVKKSRNTFACTYEECVLY